MEEPKMTPEVIQRLHSTADLSVYLYHIPMFLYYPVKGLCWLSNSITDIKRYFIHLGICSLGNESDLELEKKYKEDDREKAPKRPRTQRTEKVQKISGKEAGQTAGAKKPIISVVLTAHEAIPGDHGQWEVTEWESCGKSVPGAAWQFGPWDPEQLTRWWALL